MACNLCLDFTNTFGEPPLSWVMVNPTDGLNDSDKWVGRLCVGRAWGCLGD